MKRLAILLFLLPMSVNADLIGTEVGCSITPTPFWVCDQPTNIVGAGIEFELELPDAPDTFGLSVDIFDSSITIANVEDNAFGLGANEILTLTFVNEILGISNLFVSGVSVISEASFSIFDNSLSIDIDSNAVYQVGSYFSFDIAVAQVPEPGTLALFGIGLLGMAATRRRRKI